jgi:hypothetical protein
MEIKGTTMTNALNSNQMNETYNGWTNWETWNVSLWIGNDEGLYNLACETARNGGTYGDLVCSLLNDFGSKETPDGCKWDDVNINGIEVNEMMAELVD